MFKTLLLNIFLWKTIILFFINRKVKVHHLFEIEVFCNIIHVLTVTFDTFNASLLKKILLTSNF